MKNYWQILGLEEGATLNEIKSAYKQYAKKFHPDLHHDDEFFKERFQEIQEAYEILSKEINQPKEESNTNYSNFPEPEIIYFTSSSNKANIGDIIILNWEVTNAEEVYLKDIGIVDSISSKKIKIKQFRNGYCTFELIAKNASDSISSKIQIKQAISTEPIITTFRANKTKVTDGEKITLTWDTQNTNKVICSEILGDLPPQGQQTITMWFHSQNHKFIYLYAYGINNIYVKQAIKLEEIIHEKQDVTPQIIYFHSDKYTISEGESITLSWNVKKATRIICSELGDVSLQGEGSFIPHFSNNKNSIFIYLRAYDDNNQYTESIIKILKFIPPNQTNHEKNANNLSYNYERDINTSFNNNPSPYLKENVMPLKLGGLFYALLLITIISSILEFLK